MKNRARLLTIFTPLEQTRHSCRTSLRAAGTNPSLQLFHQACTLCSFEIEATLTCLPVQFGTAMCRAIFTARWNGQSQNERIIEQNEKISMLLSLRVTENLSKPEISSKPQLRAAMIGAVPVLPTVSLWWPFGFVCARKEQFP